jgi:hypothetical protein
MHADLLAPFDGLERRTRNLLAQLAALDEAQRRFRPDADAWCLLQVAEHLAITEETVLQALRKGIPEGRRRRRLRDRLAKPLVLAIMHLPVRVRAPLPVLLPREVHDLETVRRRWNTARTDLGAFLAAAPPASLGEPAVSHPVAGPLTLVQAVHFLNSHFDHHLYQVDRIRKHPGFPPAGVAQV